MAKQQPLNESWVEKVPKSVTDAAEEYMKLLRAKNRANEKMKQAKEKCIEEMTEHEIERVYIDDLAKWLVCVDSQILKTEAAERPSSLEVAD